MISNPDAVRQLTELGFPLVTATEMSSGGGVERPKRTASELYPTQRERNPPPASKHWSSLRDFSRPRAHVLVIQRVVGVCNWGICTIYYLSSNMYIMYEWLSTNEES